MKKRLLFLCFFSFSVLINIIPLLIFKGKAVISNYSYAAIGVITLVSANGILSYFLRHKGNFLSFATPRGDIWGSDKDYTFSKEYNREFYWQFVVYFVTSPFYIPCIFFPSNWLHTLWTLCVLFAPQMVYVVYGILSTLKDVKEYRATQQKREQELKEQQQREEMGRFK